LVVNTCERPEQHARSLFHCTYIRLFYLLSALHLREEFMILTVPHPQCIGRAFFLLP
jgi:hypothetical protein